MALLADEVAGPRYKDAGGHLPVLAALKLVMAPPSKHGFSELWKPVAAGRFIKVPASGVDHRRFWGAMHRLSMGRLAVIAEAHPGRDGGPNSGPMSPLRRWIRRTSTPA